MFSQLAFVGFLAQMICAIYAEHEMVDIVRPRSKSIDEHERQIRDFWTADKLKAAKTLDLMLTNTEGRTIAQKVNHTTGPPSNVSGCLPEGNSTLSRAISSSGAQVRTTGRIFWQSGQGSYSCSGAVVSSTSQDLIATAGHCVYDTKTRQWFNNNNWMFVPAYSDGQTPYGKWPARRMVTGSGWTGSGDYNADVAFAAVSTVNGKHIQAVVGAQGIAFNQPRSAFIYSFGYPANLDSSRFLKSCAAKAQKSQASSNYIGQGLPCGMTEGCSGGPWLQNVVESTGLGHVTSVNSFGNPSVPNVVNGPYFDSKIESLYNQAKDM